MIDFFYKIYGIFCNESKILEKSKINGLFRKFTTILANVFVPIYFRLSNNFGKVSRIHSNDESPKLVASLTSFPARIENIWIVVESIIRQTVKPDKLVLWLSKEQFSTIECLPSRLRNLQERGLEIVLCDEDLRSHKKYFYVLNKYPQSDLFTFDDDIMYASNTIERVLSVAKKNPKCVVGWYCNHIKKDENGEICFDRNFNKSYVNIARLDTFIGSGGGALYPAGSLPQIAQEKDVFMSICKTADDIWLNTMCRYSGYSFIAINKKNSFLAVYSKNNSTLFEINCGAENHKQLQAVRDYCITNGVDPYESL